MVKLSRGITFLKRRFRFSPTGKVVVTPCKVSIARVRRRMRKHARMVAEGRMTAEQARTAYVSFRGSLVGRRGDGVARFRIDAHRTVRELDKLYRELFGSWPISRRP